MENQNYTFFIFRSDYGIFDHSLKDHSIFEKRYDLWTTIGHLPLAVISEELKEIPYDSTMNDLLESYERYVNRKAYVLNQELKKGIETDIPKLFGFNTLKFKCEKCNWEGLGSETTDIGMTDWILYDIGCPNCHSMASMGHVSWNSEIMDYKLWVSERFAPRGHI